MSLTSPYDFTTPVTLLVSLPFIVAPRLFAFLLLLKLPPFSGESAIFKEGLLAAARGESLSLSSSLSCSSSFRLAIRFSFSFSFFFCFFFFFGESSSSSMNSSKPSLPVLLMSRDKSGLTSSPPLPPALLEGGPALYFDK